MESINTALVLSALSAVKPGVGEVEGRGEARS